MSASLTDTKSSIEIETGTGDKTVLGTSIMMSSRASLFDIGAAMM